MTLKQRLKTKADAFMRCLTHPLVADMAGLVSLVLIVAAIIQLLNLQLGTSALLFIGAACAAKLDLTHKEGGLISHIIDSLR